MSKNRIPKCVIGLRPTQNVPSLGSNRCKTYQENIWDMNGYDFIFSLGNLERSPTPTSMSNSCMGDPCPKMHHAHLGFKMPKPKNSPGLPLPEWYLLKVDIVSLPNDTSTTYSPAILEHPCRTTCVKRIIQRKCGRNSVFIKARGE